MCDNIYFKNEKRMCQTLKRLGREEMAVQMCRDITKRDESLPRLWGQGYE